MNHVFDTHGLRALNTLRTTGFVLPEEEMAAGRALRAGLGQLASDPLTRPQAAAIRRVMHGSPLAEDHVFANRGLDNILNPLR